MNRLLLTSATILSLACAEAPALEVSGVRYGESDLLGLSPERRQALADLTVFAAAVASGGLEALGRPLIDQDVERRVAELLRAQLVFDSMGIGEAQLRTHYQGSPELELSVRHLIVLSARYEADATRAAARAKAERALGRIRAGEPFPAVAAEISEDPGAQGRQGLLPPGREGSWVDEFWHAALALEVGEISPVVETQYGFHVLRLKSREAIPFEEARNVVTLKVAEMVGVRDPRVDEPGAAVGVAAGLPRRAGRRGGEGRVPRCAPHDGAERRARPHRAAQARPAAEARRRPERGSRCRRLTHTKPVG
jgi:hypothetical protein